MKIKTNEDYINALKMITNEIKDIAEAIIIEIDDLYWTKTGILEPINKIAYENSQNDTFKNIEKRIDKVRHLSRTVKEFAETEKSELVLTSIVNDVNVCTDKVIKSIQSYTDDIPLSPPVSVYIDLFKAAVNSFNSAIGPKMKDGE